MPRVHTIGAGWIINTEITCLGNNFTANKTSVIKINGFLCKSTLAAYQFIAFIHIKALFTGAHNIAIANYRKKG